MTAALQCGPDGKLEGDTSLGTRALESCAYLAQSMLAHNFRDGPPISSHEMEMFQVWFTLNDDTSLNMEQNIALKI